MAEMNPILRLRRVFRDIGADAQQADEAADAIEDYSYSRNESRMLYEQVTAQFRADLAEFRNQVILAVLFIMGLAVTIISVVIATS